MAERPANDRGKCFTCGKERIVYSCEGCSQKFCVKHLPEHRQQLGQELNGIENDRDELHQSLIEQKNNRQKLPLMQRVDKWEVDSITKIRQTAQECRQLLVQHQNDHILDIENKLAKLTEELKRIRKDDEFNEIDLNRMQGKLRRLRDELNQPRNIKIQQETTSFISKISVVATTSKSINSILSDREVTYL